MRVVIFFFCFIKEKKDLASVESQQYSGESEEYNHLGETLLDQYLENYQIESSEEQADQEYKVPMYEDEADEDSIKYY